MAYIISERNIARHKTLSDPSMGLWHTLSQDGTLPDIKKPRIIAAFAISMSETHPFTDYLTTKADIFNVDLLNATVLLSNWCNFGGITNNHKL